MKQNKLKLPLLLLCSFFVLHGYAQKVSIGVRSGILLTKFGVTPKETGDPDFKNIVVPQGALFAEIGIGNCFAIQPEIMYGTHGGKYYGSNAIMDHGYTDFARFDVTIKINTIEVPVLAKVKFGSDAVKFYALAGPSIGLGLNGNKQTKVKYTSTNPNANYLGAYEENLKAVFKKDQYPSDDIPDTEFAAARTNVNLHFGAGVNYKIGKISVFLDGRYILGMRNMLPEYPFAEKQAFK
ncbi:MAG: porin family protein, partial [Bacteroidota bacterium]